jgi:glycerol-3-phosphate dehydrogenase
LPAFSIPGAGELPPLPGARWPEPPAELRRRLVAAGLDAGAAEHVLDTYGGRSARVLAILAAEPATRRPIAPGAPHIVAEAVLARRDELATSAHDFARRRDDLALRLLPENGAPPAALVEVFQSSPSRSRRGEPALSDAPSPRTGDAA